MALEGAAFGNCIWTSLANWGINRNAIQTAASNWHCDDGALRPLKRSTVAEQLLGYMHLAKNIDRGNFSEHAQTCLKNKRAVVLCSF